MLAIVVVSPLPSMSPVLEQGFFQQAYEQYCAVVETLSAAESGGWEHGEVERYINESGRELLRRLFQGHLDRRYSEAVEHRPVVGADGEVRPHRRDTAHPTPARNPVWGGGGEAGGL